MLLSVFARNGNRTRERILEVLRKSPGMNVSELRKAVGLAWATAAYHLQVLARQGFVHLEPKRRGHLCFLVDIPARHRGIVSALRDPETVRVLAALVQGHAMGITQLSNNLGLSEQTVRTRLVHLQDNGLVIKRGELRPRFSLSPQIPPDLLARPSESSTADSPAKR